MTDRKKAPALTAGRPSRTGRPEVERARRDVTATDEPEKRLPPVYARPSYHQRLQAIRSMSRDNVPAKALLLEAVEDLFEKYASGKGRYPIARQAQLERMLEELRD